MPAQAMRRKASSSVRVRVQRSSVSLWASSPQGVLALDDREHLEPAPDPGQVGGHGVPGLVGGHHLLLQRGVGDRLLHADLLRQLGLADVGPAHAVAARPQGPDQRLVEQVLDHHRGVAEGDVGQLGPLGVLVQLPVVGLQVTTPLLITEPEDEQFWPGQSQALHDLLPGPRELVRFTAAEGASRHCEPRGLAARDTRVFDWLGRHLTA